MWCAVWVHFQPERALNGAHFLCETRWKQRNAPFSVVYVRLLNNSHVCFAWNVRLFAFPLRSSRTKHDTNRLWACKSLVFFFILNIPAVAFSMRMIHYRVKNVWNLLKMLVTYLHLFFASLFGCYQHKISHTILCDTSAERPAESMKMVISFASLYTQLIFDIHRDAKAICARQIAKN